MEQVTSAPEEGKDSVDEQNAPDSTSLTGKTADQDHQILVDTGDTNWYKSTQALKYLQPVFVPIVKDNIKSLQRQTMTDFGRQLCAEATSDDIIRANNNLAKFKHFCPGTVIACQNLINIIKGHTTDSVRFYQMLIGTDPQNWLKSPFEFARLFLKDWMRRDIHDFKECDITALCTIVMRCKPLMQVFEERKIDELRKVRNRTMHPATMSITQQEMEQNINVILEFLEHIKTLTASDDATKAIECIKQLRTSDVSLLHTVVDRLIRGWIPGAKIQYELKLDAKNNQLQDINYMENKLARMSSAQEATAPTKQSEELELEAKEPKGNWSLDDVSSLENGSAQKQDCNQAPPERQADGVDEITYDITTHHQPQYCRGNRQMTFKKLIKRTLGPPILGPLVIKDNTCEICEIFEHIGQQVVKCTVTEERDSDEDLYLPFIPMTAGENADEVQKADDFEEITCGIKTLCLPELGSVDDFDEFTYGMNSLDETTNCMADEFDENTYSLETLGLPTPGQADEFDDTYCMELLGLTTPSPADDFDENTNSLETLDVPTSGPLVIRDNTCEKCEICEQIGQHEVEESDSDEDWNVVASPRKKGENAAYEYQADDFDEITYGMNSPDEPTNCMTLGLPTPDPADDFDEIAYGMEETLLLATNCMCTVTVESDSMTAGENADQDHQILTNEGDTNWFKTTQSLKYLQPVLLSYIEDKIIRLHEETLTDFGRQLCTEATSDDIIRARGNVAQFKHLCPGTVDTCQNLLNIIKGHTRDSVDFYQMLKGTDPQNWLKSPFEFARLFLKDWMRSDIHDFQECDILALCTIIKRCKPLMQIFDERKLDELRNVRNRTMHPHTMSICQHEMEDHINAILDFLEHMKTLKNTDEVITAMESITQSRTDDVRSRQSIFVRLIQGWLPGARMEYKHKLDEANNQLKDIHHMENKLVSVSAAQEATAGITQKTSMKTYDVFNDDQNH